MNIVCIDTSSSMSVTAKGCRGIFSAVIKSAKGQYSANLIPLIGEVVKNAGFSINETEKIVCPQGPGSFTGLRIAYAAAKALTLTSGAKFYCVPVLDVLAYEFLEKNEQVISVIDAKRDRFYVQAFINGSRAGEAADISAEEAVKKADLSKNIIVCGIGTEKFKLDIAAKCDYKNISFFEVDCGKFSEKILNYTLLYGNIIEVCDYDGPVYIRKSDAEKS